MVVIKKIIKKEDDFIDNILHKSHKIGHDFNYNEISYDRFVEYIIDLILRYDNKWSPILHENSKDLLEKQKQGFENVYIFNKNHLENDPANLRLCLLEVKSFEPNEKIAKYKDFLKEDKVLFSNLDKNNKRKESRLKRAFNDLSDEEKKSSNRKDEAKHLKRIYLDDGLNKKYVIRNQELDRWKETLQFKKVGSTDELINDFKTLLTQEKVFNIAIGTLVNDANDEHLFIKHIEQNNNTVFEEINCIVAISKDNDYKRLIDIIVNYNKEVKCG